MAKIIQKELPFFQVPNKIFESDLKVIENNEERKMKSYEKLVLIYLFRCTNNGKKAFPSYETIASCCSINKRTVIKAIKILVENKIITKKNRGKYKGEQTSKNFSNVYEVDWSKIENLN